MARNDSTVGINLQATNNASGPIDNVRRSLKDLDGAASVATGGISGLGKAFGAVALVTFAQQVGQTVVELAQLGAATESIGNSFEGLAQKAGAAPTALLNSLKQASNGTISEYNLMLAANKAMLLGVADNAEEMGALMQIAQSRGRAMGLSVTQAFNDLVTGLGRASPLILDNLGITVDAEATNKEYAASIGKVASQLTEQEKKQALVNKVMAEAGNVDLSNVESMASSFERAQASIADMKAALGELFGPAVAAIADKIAEAAGAIKDVVTTDAQEALVLGFEKAEARIERARNAALAYTQAMATAPPGMLEEITRLEAAGATWDMVTGEAQGYFILLQDVKAAQADLAAQTGESAKAISDYYAGLIERQKELIGGGGINPFGEAGQNAIAQAQASADAIAAAYGDAFTQIATMSSQMADKLLPDMGPQVFGQIDEWAAHYQEQFTILTSYGYTLEQALKIVGVAIEEDTQRLSDLATAAGEAEAPLRGAGEAAFFAAFGIDDMIRAAGGAVGPLASAAGAANAAALQFFGLGDAALDARSKMDSALAGMATLNAAKESIERAAAPGQGGLNINPFERATTGAKAAAQSFDLVRYMSPAVSRSLSSMGGAASKANSEFSSLESTVKGLLQSSLDPGVGVDVDKLLPREDAINENARRLADIAVNGFKGQSWLEEFKAEVPDIYKALVESGDPKTAAAQFLRDFQDGLVPQLIDKETAKARVRRMLLGQSTMAALATEIATELSQEMGVSMAQAQAAVGQALGTGAPAGGTGAIVDGTGPGGAFVDGFSQAIAARAAQIQASGSTAGATWGTGFLSTVEGNVPQQLLTILTVLITPLVIAQINSNNGRKGAN